MRGAPALCLALVGTACGPEGGDLSFVPFSLPYALPVACAAMPSDLAAEAWVSGSRGSTPLLVDPDAGTTSGALRVTTGVRRRVVVDWFVVRPSVDGAPVRVLLAQAARDLDLRAPEGDLVLALTKEDIDVTTCRDVTGDVSRTGSLTTLLAGEERPACDLDDSCAGTPAVGCSNLGELCAGLDPLGSTATPED
jgi:hypothetical protein